MTAHGPQQVAAIAQGLGVGASDRERLVVGLQGRFIAPQRLQGAAAVAMRLGIIASQGRRALKTEQGIGMAGEGLLRDTQIQMGWCGIGADFQGRPQQFDTLVGPAQLQFQNAGKMQRIEVFGLCAQYLLVQAGGLIQAALPLQGEGVSNHLGGQGTHYSNVRERIREFLSNNTMPSIAPAGPRVKG